MVFNQIGAHAMKPIYLAAFLLAACAARPNPADSAPPPPAAPEQPAPVAQPVATAPNATATELSRHGWRITHIGRHAANGSLAFNANNRVNASFGCNSLSGHFSHQGQNLQIGELATTLMLCPPNVQAQEEWLSAAFARTAAYRINGNKLELLDRRQHVILQAEPAR